MATINPVRESLPLPNILNPDRSSLEKNTLKKERWKFGLGMVLSESEEVGLGALPAVIIRSFGGTEFHLGLKNPAISSMFQFLGAVVLRLFKSNRKAMLFTMVSGMVVTVLIGITLFSPVVLNKSFQLWGFLIFMAVLSVVQGLQWNISSGWIGDLVPKESLSWFTSLKWILATMGIIVFSLLIGKYADWAPHAKGYAGIYFFFAVSYGAAFILYGMIRDRVPKNVSYFKSGADGRRFDYRNPVFLKYTAFYSLWVTGRTLLFTFSGVFLIDVYHFNMMNLAWMNIIPFVVGCASIFVMGKVCAKHGHRKPLIVLVAIVGTAMMAWPLSAWVGLGAIFTFQVINGIAGHGFSMLAINLGLEFLPEDGRTAYLGVARSVTGFVSLPILIGAGQIMFLIRDFHATLWGAELNYYHLCFFVAALITVSCIIPLLAIKKGETPISRP